MPKLIIKNATIVNENQTFESDLAIENQRIIQIENHISVNQNDRVYDTQGLLLLPGMIDDQVHFREPGLTHKGTIASESRAAVAGGITSYMEMPNVNPSTTTIAALKEKHTIAKQTSLANYSFYLGATPNNIEQIKQVDSSWVCGVKVFMGASTGDLLVEHPTALEAIFKECPTLIVTHCENGEVIRNNLAALSTRPLVPAVHPVIRDAEACFQSSSYAVDLAKKFNSDLHVLHLTTAKEMALFEAGPIEHKKITAEACVHHLWFNQTHYSALGNLIKCNPAIKAESDRLALIQAINDNRIDIIATDHAPHTFAEKAVPYSEAPAGLPLVQHALLSLLDHTQSGALSLTKIVEKIAHNPAKRYHIEQRGFIREGYFADLVLIDPNQTTSVHHDNCHYLCKWTPFHGHTFSHKIAATFVNGQKVFDGSSFSRTSVALPLAFNRQ
ncbi:dihydroorotase [Alteromonas sp. 5E99-2]|uniref:dihydroorotase n=1 Tax=Alteromonas sp. 5E99-2 TaxID=2817683 RepID=UPI001A987680|nr:dihydroorotase [Alteromonas sp. 5E99-2]MBO1254359.1 dihydroorotase [Alteromonas sp. 5E99-2]